MNRHDLIKGIHRQQVISAVIGLIFIFVMTGLLLWATGCKMIKHEIQRELVDVIEDSMEQVAEKKVGSYAIDKAPWILIAIMSYFTNKFRLKAKNGNGKNGGTGATHS